MLKKLFMPVVAVLSAVLITTGCSSSPDGSLPTAVEHHGVVYPPNKLFVEKGLTLAAWENESDVLCGENGYAVYTDEDRRKQKCFRPAENAKFDRVLDPELLQSYECSPVSGKKKVYLAYVDDSRMLVFCHVHV